jgi:selenide,water dikinase
VLSYGPLSIKARWARWLKDRIDRRWIEKFVPPPFTPPPAGEEEHLMRCGGCGAKVSGDVLTAALRRLDVLDDPRVLVGCRGGEDAAVFATEADSKVEVQTVDYFKSFIDDPYLFGRVAALHSVSDLYAMNARPFAALAIATLPHARGPVQEATLREMLSGASEEFRKLGVVLAGGHTSEGAELAIGFAMTGHGEKDELFHKGGLRDGDALVLTKPLGSGALLAAWMRGQCKAAWYEELMRSLLIANDGAAEVFREVDVTACTDITGFGLGGHLLEMLDASGVSAVLSAQSVPLYDGFAEVTGRGIVSTLHRDNAKLSCRVEGAPPAWLFDPQTSGGLLAGVRPNVTEKVVRRLRQRGLSAATLIGRVVAAGDAVTIRLE